MPQRIWGAIKAPERQPERNMLQSTKITGTKKKKERRNLFLLWSQVKAAWMHSSGIHIENGWRHTSNTTTISTHTPCAWICEPVYAHTLTRARTSARLGQRTISALLEQMVWTPMRLRLYFIPSQQRNSSCFLCEYCFVWCCCACQQYRVLCACAPLLLSICFSLVHIQYEFGYQ